MMEYAGAAWCNCCKEDASALERIQIKVTRSVLFPNGDRVNLVDSAVLERVQWPTLAWRRRLSSLCLFWQMSQGAVRPKLADCIPRTAAQRTDYSLRKRKNLAFPWCNSHHRRSFLPSSVALWNALPLNVQSAVTLSTFHPLLSIHFSSDRFGFGLS